MNSWPNHFFCKKLLSLPLLLALGAVTIAGARELSAYRVGDVVEDDIIAPVEMAVPDPGATDALKASEALKIPAVFRSCPAVTNALAARFEVAFETARSNFISALQDTFHATVLDHATIVSPDFGYLVTAYNFDHPEFALPNYLAMDWAYGKDGAVEKMLWLNKIFDLMQVSIRPDQLPPGFELGDTVQLVTVRRLDEIVTTSDVATRGRIVSQSTTVPLSRAQLYLRCEFTGNDEQLLARTLAAWVQPNCLADPAVTQETREEAVRRMVVAEYYSAGQVIATKGSVVDQRIMAAIEHLTEKPASFTSVPARDWREAQAPIALGRLASIEQDLMADPGPPLPPDAPSAAARLALFGILLLAGIIAVAAIVLVVIRQVFRPQNRVSAEAVVPDDLQIKNSPRVDSGLAPQILQVVRQAFIHELAGQRRDLLSAQQTAAAEVITLVQRMDALQVSMQDRLRTYEVQIQQLEAELTARKEENRQLIRLKIQLIRHQADLETTPQRVELN